MLSDYNKPVQLLVLSASLNAGVMLLYSVLLLWQNNRVLKGGTGHAPDSLCGLAVGLRLLWLFHVCHAAGAVA